ncbi:ATP--cob(I)alamin adenosyltransferase [Fusobacterium necrophorum subsp. funduliforme]|uniref:ATP--cob(I)alamin adenosyltransferase n=1 Tax=Fusobacterium necrophorum subsp. funduliforme TaxID=143387 RepID=A0A162J9S8_9FUSO|nr:BREX system P-loop protein BrxC [Fusobacterium necrophorum]AYV92949.1 BREX system P-loop protein BrxC [Fusobacterium necrophorum subsp. funduliforme]KYL05401.1 ATP--cob(I)alamin adenosyltransferase [Fusobacterium necrophorum subsp. funduliforme]KYM45316.1 ATP--cob(I)alamin adenosyltransferase [Fusobacterium necrophorum subsp. funduliforme]KYM60605.1 ATP--cob(I)alamin adenosyltransferase [Fusobacterium necrophorum subsp. funduliforme]KYM66402.1 ATP--cob(I)alamin adenosyltransferase [Fusobact
MKNCLIQSTFQKDITRKINGVIKADSKEEDVIVTELSEYVVTEEIQKYLNIFFNRYVDSLQSPTEDIGVWISGFFGSGKSHFLKMIGRILENKEYQGKKVIDFFEEKIQDAILQKNIEKAAEVPTDVILFNIDNVSDQNTQQNKDTIPIAFLKKFNEYLGFSRDNIKIADFERMLWEKGKFEIFQKTFAEISGKIWKEEYRNLDFDADDFLDTIEKLEIMSREAAIRWLEKESDISISAESLADLLEQYLKKQSKEHRIVFLVDEIGQYIGENSQLMLNLQTLVETLGVKFKGRIWVGVTSQQDLGNILGKARERSNDFSKIQDRFKTMLPLSSANIDEVIKKRLLEKKQLQQEELESLYDKTRIYIENAITFDKTGMTLALFEDRKDFAESYPFVGYQFNLLQKVFEKVRNMGYSGQHMSRGERSLLSSFQEAGIRVKDMEVGSLVPFQYFYQSIEQFLEDNVRRPFIHAKNERGIDEFGLEVLKLLFLLKGIKGITPNINNLVSFMVDSVDCDRLALEEKIKKALGKLEQQVLIQKDGEGYYFLTNEEQDINKEINQELINEQDVYKELNTYIFGQIFTSPTVTMEDTKNKYNFSQKIDEIPFGKIGGQLDILILTPRSDEYDNIAILGYRDGYDLILRLPEEMTYWKEIQQSLRIASYVQKTLRGSIREVVHQILQMKQQENSKRKQRIQSEVERMLSEAEIYIQGQKVNITTTQADKRIAEALKAVARHRFNKAKLIQKPYYESEIRNVLSYEYDAGTNLFDIKKDMSTNPNYEALQEILTYITLHTSRGNVITLKHIVEYFSKKPYGWEIFSIHGLVAELWIYKQIQIEESKNPIHNAEELKILLVKSQSKTEERLVISLREEIDTELLQKVNNLLKKLFGPEKEVSVDQPKKDILEILKKKIDLPKMYSRECESGVYPGKKELQEWIDLLEEILFSKEKTEKLLKHFLEMEEELLEAYDNQGVVLDFFRSSKKKKFDEGLEKRKKIKEYEAVIGSIQETKPYQDLVDILTNKSPYNQIKHIDALLEEIQVEEEKLILEEKNMLLQRIEEKAKEFSILFQERDAMLEKTIEKLKAFKNKIEKTDDLSIFFSLSDWNKVLSSIEMEYRKNIQEELRSFEKAAFEVTEDKTDVKELVEDIRNTFHAYQEEAKSNDVDQLEQLIQKAKKDQEGFILQGNGRAKKKERVQFRKIRVAEKSNIETIEAVEEYISKLENEIQSLKEKMLQAIRENKIVDIQ